MLNQSMDILLAKWTEQCDETLTEAPSITLEERMKQLGRLLGPGGRRCVLSCLETHQPKLPGDDDDTAQFLKDVGQYIKRPAGKSSEDIELENLAEQNNSSIDEPSPKRGKPAEKSFKERCLEWYHKQPGVPQEPSASIMGLFTLEFKDLEATSSTVLNNFSMAAFENDSVAAAFVKFLKSLASEKKPITVSPERKAAFHVEYVDANNTVDDFIDYVDECHAEYKIHHWKYDTPCISLCQSSGYGKSRLLQQVSKQRTLLYVCVGDSDSSYPGPNWKARSFFFSNVDIKTNRQDHVERQLEHCVSWCLLQRNDLTTMNQFEQTPAAFWDEITKHDETKNDYKSLPLSKTLWIAFDEAQSLFRVPDVGGLSNLQILRRAIRRVSYKVGHRLFAILTDTKVTIPNVVSCKPVSSSYRPNPDENNGFHPYFLLLTQDAFKKSSQQSFTEDWSFANCGRPLWKALYQEPSKSGSKMISYAAQLLPQSRNCLINDELALLAIMICRTGVYLSPQSSTASDLLKYMATLVLSDNSHEYLLVTYLSDPVLTIASAKLWYDKEQKGLLASRGLPLLRRKLVQGAVVESKVGELVARLLLLIGMDNTSCLSNDKIINGYDGKWYKVSEFMERCFGIKGCLAGEAAYIGFSHFIPSVNEPTTYQELRDLLYRRGACCLPSGKTGADLLIPFWKKTQGEPLISYVVVKIENRNKQMIDEDVRSILSPSQCFSRKSEFLEPLTDVILIVLLVGLPCQEQSRPVPLVHEAYESQVDKDPQLCETHDRRKHWVYSLQGISPETFPFLEGQDTLRDELIGLAQGSLNFEQWMACDVKQNAPPSSPGMARRENHVRLIVSGKAKYL